MCGIVGYIGTKNAKNILLNGLEKLEYRGYDSAGIALLGETLNITKVKGRIAALREKMEDEAFGTLGIGHTRWATHGVPSEENAHPHESASGRFTIVHNGVIENYQELKETYLQDVPFKSETDTEVIVQLMDKMSQTTQDTVTAFRQTIQLLQGSYAIGLLDNEDVDTLYVAKNKSPLLVGIGNGFNVIASDAMATLKETDQYVEIHDEEIVLLHKDSIVMMDVEGSVIEREPYTAELDMQDIEKGTYAHFMLKEIDEQPFVIRKIIQAYQNSDGQLEMSQDIRNTMQEADRIHIIASGTSYHAGLVGKQFIETLASIPVEVHIASEFAYHTPLLSENPLFIFISQSGETADARAVLTKVKKRGFNTMTLTNVPGSTLSRESNHTLHLHAGPEIAVASTKAYTAQIAVLALLAVDTAREKGVQLGFDLLQELAIAASVIETLTEQKDKIEELAKTFLNTTRNAFFIGRGIDYYVCSEGALKLKEISYIQAEGFAGGELKHGTIALIEEDTPVIALATQKAVNHPIRSNVQEVVSRGAKALTISMEGMEQTGDALVLPAVHEILTPLVSVVPLQLLAYYAALHRGCDVDKPRNLAKSVTVE